MLTATSTPGFQGERRRARPGEGRGERGAAARGPRRRPGPLPKLRRREASPPGPAFPAPAWPGRPRGRFLEDTPVRPRPRPRGAFLGKLAPVFGLPLLRAAVAAGR